jgi:hypothetical protein
VIVHDHSRPSGVVHHAGKVGDDPNDRGGGRVVVQPNPTGRPPVVIRGGGVTVIPSHPSPSSPVAIQARIAAERTRLEQLEAALQGALALEADLVKVSEPSDRKSFQLLGAIVDWLPKCPDPDPALFAADPPPIHRPADPLALCNVVVTDVGTKQHQLLRFLRDLHGLGIDDGMKFIAALPKALQSGVKRPEAESLVRELADAGITAEIQPAG